MVCAFFFGDFARFAAFGGGGGIVVMIATFEAVLRGSALTEVASVTSIRRRFVIASPLPVRSDGGRETD